jgi:hypothetical protein
VGATAVSVAIGVLLGSGVADGPPGVCVGSGVLVFVGVSVGGAVFVLVGTDVLVLVGVEVPVGPPGVTVGATVGQAPEVAVNVIREFCVGVVLHRH